MIDSSLCHQGWFPIGPVELGQVASDTLLELLHARFKLSVGEILITVVDRFEFAAIDRNYRLREQIEAAAQRDEFAADPADREAGILTEVSNRFEVRHQFAG